MRRPPMLKHTIASLRDESDLFVRPERAPEKTGKLLSEPRLRFLRLVSFAAIGILLVQGLKLQIATGSLFFREAEENRVRELINYAPRGIFLDRFGTQLAQNIPAVELVVEPSQVPANLEPLLETLREALPTRDLSTVRERLRGLDRSAGSPLPLLQGLTHEEFLAVSSREDRLQGVRAETTAVRDYLGNGPYAHVLGYLGKLSPEEAERFPQYLLTEALGKTGLEREYERLLRGQHGARRVEVDAHGSVQHDLGRQPPVPGTNLRLHLDAGLQEIMASALTRGAKTAGARKGAAVALDPFSGSIRALVSLPSFPHSDLAHGLDSAALKGVLTNQDSPLLNRVTQGQYVPGSSFKLAVAAAALEDGIATPTTTVESKGGLRVGQWFFPDWKAGGHGRTNLAKALAESVNTYFYMVAGGVGEFHGLGIERLTAWAKKLGAGEPTGIDLPEEAPGFLPSPAWKEQQKGEVWYIGDTYHAAIGQGDVLVTPLQLAVVTATIANGGTVYAPRLVDTMIGPESTSSERQPPIIRAENVIQRTTAEAVRGGMRAAVAAGSAQGLQTLPVTAAAKTGTAQIGGTEKTHAWVTAFAPYERPELVLVVLVEEGGAGERVAVPIAREILSWYFSPEQRARRESLSP